MSTELFVSVRERIGRSVTSQDLLCHRLVRLFRATLNPYLFAAPGLSTPLGIHWCLAPCDAADDQLAVDGHPRESALLPETGAARRMWVGGELEFHEPLQEGSVVTRYSTLTHVRRTSGRSGPLIFVCIRHEIHSDGVMNVSERQDLVFRPALATSERSVPSRVASGLPDFQWFVDSSPVRLFRYSALTFNAHRVHYDLPYAMHAESYKGLLVHAPLQATLLLNLLAVKMGRAPQRFEYRAVSPLIAGDSFVVASCDVGGVRECWTRDGTGAICMQARGIWT